MRKPSIREKQTEEHDRLITKTHVLLVIFTRLWASSVDSVCKLGFDAFYRSF